MSDVVRSRASRCPHVTPEDLCEIEAIKSLKYAYVRCLDTKDWDGIRDLFTPDAVAAYSGGAYSASGRDEIVGFLERNMGSDSFHSSHRVTEPEIILDDDEATGLWALKDTVIDVDMGILVEGAAFYEDTYVRTEAGWRISMTGYRRIFEYLLPLADVPSLTLTASAWTTDGRSTLPVG